MFDMFNKRMNFTVHDNFINSCELQRRCSRNPRLLPQASIGEIAGQANPINFRRALGS
jgi:hypothetical protein